MDKVRYLTRHQKKKLNLSDDCLFTGVKNKKPNDSDSESNDSDVDSYGNLKDLIDYGCDSKKISSSYIKSLMCSNILNSLIRKKKQKINFLGPFDPYTERIHATTEKKDKTNKDSESKRVIYTLKLKESDSESDSDYNDDDEELWYCSNEEKYLEKVGKKVSNEYKLSEEKIRSLDENLIPFRFRLINSNLSKKNKLSILKRLDDFYSLETSDNEYHKLNTWVKGVQKIPFGKYKTIDISSRNGPKKIRNYLTNIYSKLEKSVYGHRDAKIKILQIISKWIVNPKSFGNVIALCGPMGNGKTTLVKKGISEAINKPFTFIGLGGACDSSFLEGHDYTYEGSRNGRIVEILKSSGCMNPIIFFDELDKLSETKKGNEISNMLCHITDPSQNDKFNDRYYSGIDLDISRALFIFSLNDETKINPILKDRITVIHMKGFKVKDKINIFKNYLLPDILKEYNFNKEDITFEDDVINYIITNYTKEEGVRKLKETLDNIVSKLNVFRITNFSIPWKPTTDLSVEVSKGRAEESKVSLGSQGIDESEVDELTESEDLVVNTTFKTKNIDKVDEVEVVEVVKVEDLEDPVEENIKIIINKTKPSSPQKDQDKKQDKKQEQIIKIKSKISFPIKITKNMVNELVFKKDDLPISVRMMYM